MNIYINKIQPNNETSKEVKIDIKAYIRINAGKWNDISDVVKEIKKEFPNQVKETEINDYIKEIENNKFVKSEIQNLGISDLQKIAVDLLGYNSGLKKQELIDLINPEDDK